MNMENVLEKAKEQQLVVLHLGLPMGIYKTLNELALKEKKNLATFIGETLRDKAEKVAAKHESPKEGG